ncbi:hypothetical protein J2T57_002593 [Natronocella acetinitrilica]|uniref:Uncharacterized protein n=1 Tax=Natronocella acetinitrilica TaxID=414046 RepID=A0AAE3G5E1_9GAMM|nr:hypothetical protein [Natronocella acetinitrilica]MCP1675443.1 hypothetical protein [Natronocella acetinitrilica]
MASPIDGRVELVNGEYWDVSPFTLQQSMRLQRDPDAKAFIASVAERAPHFLQLRQWVGSQSEALRGEAVEALCNAMEGHDRCLLALTALATGRSVQAIQALGEVDQAVLVLGMIVENESFFGRRLASHMEETASWKTSSSNSLAEASAAKH